MADQEVRAPKVVERTATCFSLAREPERIDRAAFRTPSCHGLLLALRALFAFMPIASMHLVAQASEIELTTRAVSGDQEAPAPDASRIEPAHYRASHDTPPVCELKALEPQDAERDVGLDARATELLFSLAPLLSSTVQVLRGAPLTWMAQFSMSSVLPRGPPRLGPPSRHTNVANRLLVKILAAPSISRVCRGRLTSRPGLVCIGPRTFG